MLGPRMTTTIGDFADLEVRARAAQVHYDTEDTTVSALLPQNSNILSGERRWPEQRERFAKYGIRHRRQLSAR